MTPIFCIRPLAFLATLRYRIARGIISRGQAKTSTTVVQPMDPIRHDDIVHVPLFGSHVVLECLYDGNDQKRCKRPQSDPKETIC
jgi:hypothetical protein